MKKNKKLIMLVFLIVMILLVIYIKLDYSLSKISDMISKSNEIPNNIYIKEEVTDKAGTNITEIYRKDNLIYEHIYKDDMFQYEDVIWNFETKKKININYFFKDIHIEKIEGKGIVNPVNVLFDGLREGIKETESKYEYYGKVDVDGKKCLKFSLTNNELKERKYYYIDVENKNLYKKEVGSYYKSKFTLYYTFVYTYSYNTVTDEDILKFDPNNYQDFKIENN